MTKNEGHEYDVQNNYPFVLYANLNVNIARRIVPIFCYYFETVVSDKFGSVMYYPRIMEGITKCKYEWFIPYKKTKRGIRITCVFDVGDKDVEKIDFGFSWGPSISYTPRKKFDKETERLIVEDIQTTINNVINISDILNPPNCPKTFIAYLETPLPYGVSDMQSKKHITIFPSMINERNRKSYTAVCFRVLVHNNTEAKIVGSMLSQRVMVLLSIVLGIPFETQELVWPKSYIFNNPIDGNNITIENVFPLSEYSKSEMIEENISDIIFMLSEAAEDENLFDNKFWEAAYSYYSGLCIMQRHPTLSSISFITSLTVFSKVKQCDGVIQCKKCGELSFKHNLYSEKKGIVEYITNLFGYHPGGEESKGIKKVIFSVYDKQRSSFVHDGKLRHSEIDTFKKSAIARPQHDKIVSNEFICMEELSIVHSLSRFALMKKMAINLEGIERYIDYDLLKSLYKMRVLALGSFTVETNDTISTKIKNN